MSQLVPLKKKPSNVEGPILAFRDKSESLIFSTLAFILNF